jgi:esterase
MRLNVLPLCHSTIRKTSSIKSIPVVILHGLLGSSRNFQSWSKLLYNNLEKQHDVVVMDLRNHGRTFLNGECHMDYSTMALDVIYTLRRLNIGECHLIGHSMGGKTAAKIALTASNPSFGIIVNSLTIMDISPVAYTVEEFENIVKTVNFLVATQEEIILSTSREQLVNVMKRNGIEESFQPFLLSNINFDVFGNNSWKFSVHEINNSLDALVGFDQDGTESAFNKPTLIMKATESSFVKAKHLPKIQQLFPNFTIYTQKGAGHWLHVDKPDETSMKIAEFIKFVS